MALVAILAEGITLRALEIGEEHASPYNFNLPLFPCWLRAAGHET